MAQRPTLLCRRGMVVAEHYLAAEAGLRMSVENIWAFLEGRPEHVVV